MRDRKRNPDRYKVGRSSLVPYLTSESWNKRHHRRMSVALWNKGKVESWCKKNRWTLHISNDGHHWTFYTTQRKIIEWWPSSGKLVIGKKWKEGIHCHDYRQLLEVLELTL